MTAKMHRMHLPKVGEGVIYVPGGVPFEADTEQQYPLGSYMRIGNKEFIYARAGNTLKTDRGAKNYSTQKVGFKVLAVKIVAGDLTVSIVVASGLAIAKDELVGGEIVVFGPDNASFTRGIIGNNVIVTGDGGTLVVQLDSPAPKDFAVTEHAECMVSPYYDVRESNSAWLAVMGIPTVEAIAGQYLWLQVSGPNWCSPVMGVTGPGGAENLQTAVFGGDGALLARDATTNIDSQHAGVVISDGGATQGAPFVMLQIAH